MSTKSIFYPYRESLEQTDALHLELSTSRRNIQMILMWFVALLPAAIGIYLYQQRDDLIFAYAFTGMTAIMVLLMIFNTVPVVLKMNAYATTVITQNLFGTNEEQVINHDVAYVQYYKQHVKNGTLLYYRLITHDNKKINILYFPSYSAVKDRIPHINETITRITGKEVFEKGKQPSGITNF